MARRISLQEFILLPLFLCPFFLSLAVASDVSARRTPRLGPEILGLAAVYSTGFVLRWWVSQRTVTQPESSSPFVDMLLRGTVLGWLFGAMFYIPLAVASLFDFDQMSFGYIWNLVVFTLANTVIFALIGSACGAVLGLLLPIQSPNDDEE